MDTLHYILQLEVDIFKLSNIWFNSLTIHILEMETIGATKHL